MTIFGIGSDILSRTRIVKTYETFGDKFLKRIWTPIEYNLYGQNLDKLAKSFAAKEAFSKAYGSGIGENLSFQDLSVLRKESGQPYFLMHKNLNLTSHLSLSDEEDMILAFVILES